MNRCGYEQKSSMVGFEERERRVMMMEPVVCPKPRRVGSVNSQIRPLRLPVNHQTEIGDSKAGTELLDIILSKEGYGYGHGGERYVYQVASSPPFYCGSPPSRASNPVIQDTHFRNEEITRLAPAPPSPSSPSIRKGGGCVRMKLGHLPAVRVEGFDCLSRDRRNCSISAVA